MKPWFADEPGTTTQTDTGDPKASGTREDKPEVPQQPDEAPEQKADSKA